MIFADIGKLKDFADIGKLKEYETDFGLFQTVCVCVWICMISHIKVTSRSVINLVNTFMIDHSATV